MFASHFPRKSMNISEAHELFQLHLHANGRSTHTRKQYARHAKMLEQWLQASGRSTDLASIDHVAVAHFLSSPVVLQKRGGERRRATSANGIRSSLRCFFGWARDAGYAPRSAAALVKRARCGPPPPRAIPEDDQRRLLSVLAQATDPEGRRDHALFMTMLRTGIRVGSVVALDVPDVDLERGELRLRSMKNDRSGCVFLGRDLREVLRSYLVERSQGPLFEGRRGRRLTTRHIGRLLARWQERAGISRRVSPHGLRHGFAMGLLERTQDLTLVQAALHHASIASTVAYARVAPERLREAMEA